MLTFLWENLATILVGIVVLIILVLSVWTYFRNRKKGTHCGGGCSGCPQYEHCHKK